MLGDPLLTRRSPQASFGFTRFQIQLFEFLADVARNSAVGFAVLRRDRRLESDVLTFGTDQQRAFLDPRDCLNCGTYALKLVCLDAFNLDHPLARLGFEALIVGRRCAP